VYTATSLLLAQHVRARVVMEILGHSQIALTMNTYSNPRESHRPGGKPQVSRSPWAPDDPAATSGQLSDQGRYNAKPV